MSNSITSQHKGTIISKTESLSGITSTSRLNISSKRELSVMSRARQAEGAGDIKAMTGIFSDIGGDAAIYVRDGYLKEKHR